MENTDYIHTFTKEEQDRLVRQGDLLEPHLHKHVDLAECSNILEIGCGVGAQIRVLLRRYPDLRITGVDISEDQIQRARSLLQKELSAGQLELNTCRGNDLPLPNDSFDAVYICFVLEHVPNPVSVIREAKRVLKKGGVIYCTEVFNDALYVYPPSPAIMEYWTVFNDCQRQMGGDPNIGIRLCNVMTEAGLRVKWLKDASYMVDQRMTDQKERAIYFDHWQANFLSAKQQLLLENVITADLLSEFDREFDQLRNSHESVFLYSNRIVCAHKV